MNFNKSQFTTNYSFSSPRSIIRSLSDAFSKQHCDTKEAIKYAARKLRVAVYIVGNLCIN